MKKYRFIDLFAGLGGFHFALKSLGHQCVFACEIDNELRRLYELNFGISPRGDIRSLEISSIPEHEILCAGFPCQPFSQAGNQKGFECAQWGDLFDYIVRILSAHKPKFFIIENVPNIVRHKEGDTWRTIKSRLRRAGYSVEHKILSPHEFGIPQIRRRTFIVGRRGGLSGLVWPDSSADSSLSIKSILDKNPKDARLVSHNNIKYLEVWQEFLDRYPKHNKFPTFPIWAMEFGATYPYAEQSPTSISSNSLSQFKGSFGQPLNGRSKQEIIDGLPPYVSTRLSKLPNWKINFIEQNRILYKQNKSWIDDWLPTISEFSPSFQKFEWNCNGDERNIWNYVIQFRPSGIRVKRPTTAPSLVTMNSQVPVIAWENRYMTVQECSRLQGLWGLKHYPEMESSSFKALGNAVSVDVVTKIAGKLLSLDSKSDQVKDSNPETYSIA